MKRILSLVFLLASLACGSYSYASASNHEVDLQIRNVYIQKFTKGNLQYDLEFLYAVVQNNGPDDFDGTFSVMASEVSYNLRGKEKFTGKIKSGQTEVISVLCDPITDSYYLYVDCDYSVPETNEDNNFSYFKRNEPQIGISSGWSDVNTQYYNDTIRVLPGEYFYSQFCLREFNGVNSIIGIDYSIDSYDFAGACPLSFSVQNFSDGNSNNGTYSYKNIEYYHNKFNSDYSRTTFSWMANSSESALGYWWLGNFEGENNSTIPGEVKDINIEVDVALIYPGTANTTSRQIILTRSIKTIDRIRGDVNDDGVVDQKDVDILIDALVNGYYNPWQPLHNVYQERGINYCAGNILFSRPDFVSICLLNIWVHNPNDPLVQGLGIGEMMSSREDCGIVKVANTFVISGNEVTIDAPEANVYNLTAQKSDSTLFQVTGEMGEDIILPDSILKSTIKVETVRLPETVVTKVFETRADENLLTLSSSKFDNQITVFGVGQLSVFNANGQLVWSQELDGSELIDASSWLKGLYIFKIVSDGRVQTVKALK